MSLITFSLGGLFLVASERFVFSTNWFYILTFLALIFLGKKLKLKMYKSDFMFDTLVVIPSLLFLTPETITILVTVFFLFYYRTNRILRALGYFFMYSSGTFMYYLAPNYYLKIPFFILGLLGANLVFLFMYFGKDLKEYISSVLNSYLLIIFGSLIIPNIYLFSEVTFFNLLVLFVTYTFYMMFIIIYVKNFNLMFIEKLERLKLMQENRNFMKLVDLVFKKEVVNFDEQLEKILEIICKISGFEAALLSIIDSEREIIRIGKYGIDDKIFLRLKKKPVNFENMLPYFSKRFEKDGIYFIPENSVSLESEGVYVFDNYKEISYENSWKPFDMLLVPILDENKKMIGYVSFDKPVSGMRPSPDDINLLKFLAWFIYRFLEKTPYSRYWITRDGATKETYPDFVKFCDALLEREIEATLSLLDIDNFDRINIERGPEYAEIITNYIVNYFKNMKNTHYYRLSGENLIIFFPKFNKLKTITYLGKFKESLIKEFPDISVSIGIAYKEIGENKNFFELIREAREALRIAKKSGGGRIMAK